MSTKEIKIKTGVVKRLVKEELSYLKEKERQEARISKLIQDSADEHDVRKQKEVLEETLQMIPDTKRRLTQAYQELQRLVEKAAKDEAIKATEEFTAAQTTLQEVSLQ